VNTQQIRERASRGGLPDVWRDEVYRLLDEIERLQAIVDRMEKTADGVPIAQVRGEQVWRRFGPEGLPQGSMYFQFGLAVFRGATHNEMLPISDCYYTKESAEQARAGK